MFVDTRPSTIICNAPRMSPSLLNNGNHLHHGHVVALAALLAPIVAVLAPLGLAPFLGVSAAFLLGLRRARTGIWLSRPSQVVVIVGVLFAWILASYFWTIDVNAFTEKILRLVGVLISGIVFLDGSNDLDHEGKRLVRRMLIVGIALGLVLEFVDRISDIPMRDLILGNDPTEKPPLYTFNRAATAIALLIWPAVLAIWRQRRIIAIAVFAVGLTIIVSYESNSAIASLLVGAVAFALVFWIPRKAATAIGLILATLLMISPLIPAWLPDQTALKQHQEMITNSGYHRVLIWKFVAEKIAERPLLGWGFNTSRNIPENNKILYGNSSALPLHPHNAFLQIWLELGFPGAVLGAVLIAGIMIRIGRMTTARIDKAVTAGLVLGIATIGNLSYGAWQSWWLATIWLCACFMCVAIERTGEQIDQIR